VKEQDNRICRVLRTNEHPLASVVEWHLLKNRHAVRVSAGIDLRRCPWNDEEHDRNRYQDAEYQESHRSPIFVRSDATGCARGKLRDGPTGCRR